MTELGERERGLFRDWAVRKQWNLGGEKKSDNTLAVDTPPDDDPVLEAFNALAATEIDEASEETLAEPMNGAAPEAAEAAGDEPATDEALVPENAPEVVPGANARATAVPSAPTLPAPIAKAEIPEGSWNPEPVRSAPRSERPSEPARGLSHVNERGEARMVDVSEKAETDREAVAEGYVTMQASTLALMMGGALAKGDVIAVARVAGIMAAKRTSELIPMCHPLPITGVAVDLVPSGEGRLRIEARVRTTGKTGVEMEALTAVSVAALTVYDMAKAVDRGMRVEGVRLLEKRGGKSGDWKA